MHPEALSLTRISHIHSFITFIILYTFFPRHSFVGVWVLFSFFFHPLSLSRLLLSVFSSRSPLTILNGLFSLSYCTSSSSSSSSLTYLARWRSTVIPSDKHLTVLSLGFMHKEQNRI